MRHRIFILWVVLVIRMLAAGILSGECRTAQKLKVTGKVIKIDHTISKSDTSSSTKKWLTTLQVSNFLAKTSGFTDLQSGSVVAITGKCKRSLLGFLLGRKELTDATISTISNPPKDSTSISGWLVANRDKSVDIFTSSLPSPEAELLAGMVLGAKQQLQADFKQALIKTGTIHVVVASGFNVTLVGTVVIFLLIYFVPRRVAILGAVVATLIYAIFTGGEPPVLRAWLMFSVVSFASIFGLPMLTGWVLLLCAWLMLMFDPSLLLDTSFQLTMAATAGLVWLSPLLSKFIKVGGELVSTLSAQIATLPVTLVSFHQLSLLALPVNLLILSLVTPLTIGGSILALSSVFPRFVSIPIVWFCYGLSHLFVLIIEFFARA